MIDEKKLADMPEEMQGYYVNGHRDGMYDRFCYREQYDQCQCDPEVIWNRFWKDIIEKPDGTIDVEQLKKELADMYHMMDQIPKIYMAMTGGMLSKTGYWAEQILSLNNQEIDRSYNAGYEDGQADLKTELDES